MANYDEAQMEYVFAKVTKAMNEQTCSMILTRRTNLVFALGTVLL